MDNPGLVEQMENSRHSNEEILHEAEVVPYAVVQPRMVHHVNPLTFIELSFHVEHGLVHGLSFADLVYEPAVFLILSVL